MVRRGIGTFACLLLLLVLAANARAATITVVNNNDSGPGSLRQAIAGASPGDTIVVPANTYDLTSGQLLISKSLTISGQGAGDTFIDGGGSSRVFEATGSTSTVTINGVTIRHGVAPAVSGSSAGGGVLNTGGATLTLAHDVIDGDSADANGAEMSGAGGFADGGGVYNDTGGTLTVIDSVFSNDIAEANGDSGEPGGFGLGGGLYTEGTLLVQGSTFTGDTADALGGTGPTNSNQFGGHAEGGGVDDDEGEATTISSSTIDDARTDASGGPGGFGGLSEGSGVWVDNLSPVSLTNLTITGNTARSMTLGAAEGGGLFTEASDRPTVTVTNTTISGNTGTGANTNQGGNAYLAGSNTHFQNTIVNDGTGDAGYQNCHGTPTSVGHNIDSLDQCGFNASGDKVNTNPLLGPLHDNGGPAQTMALEPGSPAIDAGSNSGCPATDERGVLRPAGAACDIGAFEVATPAATTDPATSKTLRGSAFNPDIAAGTAFFQYGRTTAYGSATAAQSVPATIRSSSITASLPKLGPGIYHFRLVVMNSVATAYGGDQTFKIAPALSRLKLHPRIFAAGKHPRITYSDSGSATTTFVIQRRVHGRWKRVGRRFTHKDRKGRNSFRLKRHLAPGIYRLLVTPREHGVTGKTLRARFHVLP